MLESIGKSVKKVVSKHVESEELRELRQENDLVLKLAADWERRFWEQNHVIDTVIHERDEWKEIHMNRSLRHLNAQADLSKTLGIMSTHLKKSIFLLNKMRKEKDLEPLSSPASLDKFYGEDGEIVFDYKGFAEDVAAARALISPQTDGEQAKIDMSSNLPESTSI